VIERYGISASDADVDAAVEDVKAQNGISQAELMEALDREGVSYKDYREEVRKQIQRTKLMRRQVRGATEMTSEEAKTFYESNPSLFEQNEQVLVRHILIATLPGTSPEERAVARKKAGKALSRLNAGEDLAALAKDLSAGPTAREGGSLGWISRGDTVPDFEAAIFSLEKGQTSGVVETQIGYHIIRAEDRRAARTIPFPEVEASIKSRKLQKDMDDEFQEWLDKLRANAYIEKKL
jgi:peptidyl-prolyl cis-trans isomerase SurA